MPDTRATGCREYQELSRRRFIAAAAAAATAPAWLPRVSLAASHRGTQRDVMVSIFMRGAADGLSICVPFSEPTYYTARPTLAVPRPDSGISGRAVDLNASVSGPNGPVGFGLPPAMLPLIPAYQSGQLLFVHAAGSRDPMRSHFDAQRCMEFGKEALDLNVTSGWLARHLNDTPPMVPEPTLRAIGLINALSYTLHGAPLTLPIPDLQGLRVQGLPQNEPRRLATLRTLYDLSPEPMRSVGLNTLATIDLMNTIGFASYAPAGGAAYPDTTFGHALKSTAALIKAQVGVEAISIDYGDWDTHADQGTSAGALFALMSGLSTALAAFHRDMTAAAAPTFVVACMSEFGRRLFENASRGTDHGHGSLMMLMGNAINGGRVLTQWPGLAPSQLFEGIDLEVTIDYRDILAEIAVNRLGNTNLAHLFPGYNPVFRGVTT